MKIQTDQITPVQQTGKVQKAAGAAGVSFGELLAREVGGPEASQTASAAAPLLSGAAGLAQAVAAQAAVQGTSPTTAVQAASDRQAVMDNVNSLLSQWEKYAGQLADGGAGQLRQAYGTLENIQTGVKRLKDEHPGLDGQSPQLSSMVNELEVLAATEQIKFNRGDYL
ncbi:hypothetical protein [Fundidesulfovibrio soli]|uniref:hypothetical protein n=1 Tax=Fundidesulfovibrio soli TaxID=2922716 RepID=UPI001FAE9E5D|nr:hypothetical protein [Fundidesulfovibrio soli]